MELTLQERTQLAQLVTDILSRWHIRESDQIVLLGLPDETKPRYLTQLRQGSKPIPDDERVIDRAKHILGIQESLDVLFPMNPNMPRFWIRNKNKLFRRKVPLEMMLNDGLNGMDKIWSMLDCTRNWES
ncbi:DUF2384 domain-containing protein [Ectothiorhodospiraceae bacterium BW-2]|nr:DUF2384 domain-containing protein [Ectothiorhodospiraceae bacterium BW-2]